MCLKFSRGKNENELKMNRLRETKSSDVKCINTHSTVEKM